MSIRKRRALWLSLTCWLLFAGLTAGVALHAGWVAALDHTIVAAVTRVRPAWLTEGLTVITTLGNPLNVTVITTLFTLGLLWRRQYGAASRLAVTVACGSLVNRIIKSLIMRPRPFQADPHIQPLVHAGGWSFPSGHANGTTLLYGTLIALLWATHWPRWVKWTGTVAGALMALTTAYSRVYVQVHYPTDVLAGILSGVAVITLGYAWVDRVD